MAESITYVADKLGDSLEALHSAYRGAMGYDPNLRVKVIGSGPFGGCLADQWLDEFRTAFYYALVAYCAVEGRMAEVDYHHKTVKLIERLVAEPSIKDWMATPPPATP